MENTEMARQNPERSVRRKKKIFIALICVFSVVVVLATFLMIWFWGDSYPDFDDFREEVAIPGLDDDAVPQGVTTYEADYTAADANGQAVTRKQTYYFISAHLKSGASRIYVTGKLSGYIGYVTLKKPDGSDYCGHFGGIATNGQTLWIGDAGDGVSNDVFVCKTDTTAENVAQKIIRLAGDGEARAEGSNYINITAGFKANGRADFCYYYDTPNSSTDYLYVGEFYGQGGYATAENHHIMTNDGSAYGGFMYQYEVNTSSSNPYGLTKLNAVNVKDEEEPPKIQKIYAIRDCVQGVARTKDGFVFSQSWGLANSTLYYHASKANDVEAIDVSANRKSFKELTGENFKYEGVNTSNGTPYTDSTLYVYFFDGNTLTRTYSVPSMSEGLCTADGKVNVLFESGCYKYKLFVRKRTESIYSFTPLKNK